MRYSSKSWPPPISNFRNSGMNVFQTWNIKTGVTVLVRGVSGQGLDFKIKLKMQALDCVTCQSKGYDTQVTVKAFRSLVLIIAYKLMTIWTL